VAPADHTPVVRQEDIAVRRLGDEQADEPVCLDAPIRIDDVDELEVQFGF